MISIVESFLSLPAMMEILIMDQPHVEKEEE
jgi:hypothetical protein